MMKTDEIFASLIKDDKTLTTFSDTSQGIIFDKLPTLIPSVDSVMMGGIPLSGRSTEIFGDPNIGKSTLVANLISTAQRMGIITVYFDVEMTTSRYRMEQLGVDPAKTLTITPEVDSRTHKVKPITIETIFNKIIDISTLVHEKNKDASVLFIWDTVAMTQPDAVASDDIGAQRVATQAKSLADGIRKINATMQVNNASLIALNQARESIGGNTFLGPQIITVGGKAWQHEASLRLKLTRGKAIKKGTGMDSVELGHGVNISFEKSKIGDNAGLRTVAYLLQEDGFDITYNLIKDASSIGLLSSAGAYLAYTDAEGNVTKKYEKAWQEYLSSDEGQTLFNYLWQECIKHFFPVVYPPLFNTHAIMTDKEFPMIKGLQKYYIDIQEKRKAPEQAESYRNWKDSKGGKNGK